MLHFQGVVKSVGYSIAGHLIQNTHFLIQKKFGIFKR